MSKKNNISNLPSPSVGGLSVYLTQIKKFPMLDATKMNPVNLHGDRKIASSAE